VCGIAGVFDPGGRLDLGSTLDAMSVSMAHRGPDDVGTWTQATAGGGQVGLASRRLAIQDLSAAGHMPMSTPDGSITITYNGEIYNHPLLRRQLEGLGYRYRSNSDTETILHLYQEHGPGCLDHLNGMFAFAIWDKPRQRLFIARDHFGIKPLYFTSNSLPFAFASEAKSLFCLPDLPRRLDPAGLDEFLTFLWVPEPKTAFEGVEKLAAGHYLLLEGGESRQVRYWDYKQPEEGARFDLAPQEVYAELRTRFFDTVRAQMLSDVPVGAFLSSGLDSSSIVAAMAASSSHPVSTYTIAFPEQHRTGELTLDDTRVAARTAAHFGCRHTDILVEPEVATLLPQLVWHMDEPVADPAIIAAYLVSREARREVTVLLSGVGGDELFGGYRKYRAHYLANRYRRLPGFLRSRLIEPAIGKLPSFRGTAIKGHVRLAKKMARSGSLERRDRFVMDSIYMDDGMRQDLYADSWRNEVAAVEPRLTHLDHFREVESADFLNQMLYVDAKTFMVSLNLNYNDKMSMASSMEVRVPFLDRELAEWVAANVDPALKLSGSTTKHVFREAMRPILPAEVFRQGKAGFGAPLDHWLANDLRPLVDELLDPASIRDRGIFDPVAVDRLVREQRSGRQDWSFQVWQLLTLELWLRAFIDRSPVASPPLGLAHG
jgi:asparagine synthase (glutamine-hydrolysing)